MRRVAAKIVKKKSKWCVVSESSGRNLGCYDTKKEALKRLRQVEYFKNHPQASTHAKRAMAMDKVIKKIETYASIYAKAFSNEDKEKFAEVLGYITLIYRNMQDTAVDSDVGRSIRKMYSLANDIAGRWGIKPDYKEYGNVIDALKRVEKIMRELIAEMDSKPTIKGMLKDLLNLVYEVWYNFKF